MFPSFNLSMFIDENGMVITLIKIEKNFNPILSGSQPFDSPLSTFVNIS